MAYMNNGVGVLTMSMGAGTSVPSNGITENGTEVPTPREKSNNYGTEVPAPVKMAGEQS